MSQLLLYAVSGSRNSDVLKGIFAPPMMRTSFTLARNSLSCPLIKVAASCKLAMHSNCTVLSGADSRARTIRLIPDSNMHEHDLEYCASYTSNGVLPSRPPDPPTPTGTFANPRASRDPLVRFALCLAGDKVVTIANGVNRFILVSAPSNIRAYSSSTSRPTSVSTIIGVDPSSMLTGGIGMTPRAISGVSSPDMASNWASSFTSDRHFSN
mmetsp:Transcript_62237/g.184068  ORF Transcript_62237/g.184068 Transcript_62237/m.184068 type:complete len:211 (-) Transcript_62237:1140-1772(-)